MRSFFATVATWLCVSGPLLDQDNLKTFTYTKTKQANLEMVVHFPPGCKETDKRTVGVRGQDRAVLDRLPTFLPPFPQRG
jgi:hypothetical protein